MSTNDNITALLNDRNTMNRIATRLTGTFRTDDERAIYQDFIRQNNMETKTPLIEKFMRGEELSRSERDNLKTQMVQFLHGELKSEQAYLPLAKLKLHYQQYNLSSPSFDYGKWMGTMRDYVQKWVDDGAVNEDASKRSENEEIMTPAWVVDQQLDALEVNNPGIFSDKTKTFLDPCAGLGTYAVRLICRLMDGLADQFPSKKACYQHIIENQVFQCDIAAARLMANMFILEPKEWLDLNVFCGSFVAEGGEEINPTFRAKMKQWGVEKFDVVLGNPPYNMPNETATSPNAFYNKFILRATEIADVVTMITPSRWMSNLKGIKDLFKFMFQGGNLVSLTHFDGHTSVFPTAVIKGGVSYSVIDMTKTTGTFAYSRYTADLRGKKPTMDPQTAAVSISDIGAQFTTDINSCSIIASARGAGPGVKPSSVRPFNPDPASGGNNGLLSSYFDKQVDWASVKTEETPYICYGLKTPEGAKSGKRFTAYIPAARVTRNHDLIDQWKVLFPKAYGTGNNPEPMGTILAEPGSVCTQSYLVGGTFATEQEAKNFQDYMALPTVRFLINTIKTTQDAYGKVYANVPMLDMTRSWTDAQVREALSLTAEQGAYIDEVVG